MTNSIRTTLIIGAGASKDINPAICTGEELVKDIADRITDRKTPNDKFLSRCLDEQFGDKFSMENRVRFQEYLDNYIKDLESPSIDEFLNEVNTFPEFENDRNDILLMGYVMIIAHVFGFEAKRTNLTQKNMFEKETWLSKLSDYIDDHEILTRRKRNALKIITFNYDRIIEHYLIKWYGYSDGIIEFVNENVHHVYGRAGCLDKLSPNLIGDNTFEAISEFGEDNHKLKEFGEKYIDHIRILYDKRNDTEGLKSIIQKSNKICVFGYGFDSINNRRLGLQDCYAKKDNFKVNVYPNSDLKYRRKLSEKIHSLVVDADIHYKSCTDFLSKCLSQ